MNFYSCIAFMTLMICITNMVNNFIDAIWNKNASDDEDEGFTLTISNKKEEKND